MSSIACALGSAAGTVTLKQSDLGNGESLAANRVLAAEFPTERAGEQVLFQSRSGPLSGAQYRSAVDDLVVRLSRTPAIAQIESPLQPGNEGMRSKDGTAALLTFQITGDPATAKDRVVPALAATAAVQRAHSELFVGEFGDASANRAIGERIGKDFQRAEVTSLPVTLLILLFAFGALVAAGIPLLLGITAVAGALGVTALVSHVMPVDPQINSVILLIGLAVGIDYSLFYLRRAREERALGRTSAEALQTAAATSGRAVLFSGFVVMTAMAGMFLMGSQDLRLVRRRDRPGRGHRAPRVAHGPAGGAVQARRSGRARPHPVARAARTRDGESRLWGAVIGLVMRHPLILGGAAAAALIALAIPALSLHTVDSGAQGLPRDLAVMQVYTRIQRAFPGGAGPAVVVVSARRRDLAAGHRGHRGAQARRARHRSHARADHRRGQHVAPGRPRAVPLEGKGTDAASNRALDTLRGQVIPATLGKVPGVTARATGWTAGSRDFNDSMKAHAPLVFAFVLGLAFVLLLVTFRSIVIPLKAIALNLLSVGAAYGVLVLVFQQGHLESLLGFTSIGGVTAWLPLFLFVILFGLSMDYHVLILSRVREFHDAGMSTEDAVAHGIRATAGVVTSAALVMVGAFAIFATLGMIDFKMMGVGLAAAILIDATIVRAVLLPATMKLLGDWNWYLPRWLEWLPRLGRQDPPPPPPTPTPTPATQEPRIPARV